MNAKRGVLNDRRWRYVLPMVGWSSCLCAAVFLVTGEWYNASQSGGLAALSWKTWEYRRAWLAAKAGS